VRAYRKNAEAKGEEVRLYVKVTMDGAPHLRKVDLRTYARYSELRGALDLRLLLLRPVRRRRVRGQGRRPHARRRRAMGVSVPCMHAQIVMTNHQGGTISP
jgi:hypothetical protein